MTSNENPGDRCIEYNLQLEDYSKVLVLVKNLSDLPAASFKQYDCDIFNENECHHSPTSHDPMNVKCQFCNFVELLRLKHSNVKIIQNSADTGGQDKYLSIRYKTDYALNMLEWCEFQPWRSPYALYVFASCQDNQQMFEAIKNFEKLKEFYKKTLLTFKLFIDMKNEVNNVELIESDLNGLNLSDEINETNEIIEANLSNYDLNRNNSIFQFDFDTKENLINNLNNLKESISEELEVPIAGRPTLVKSVSTIKMFDEVEFQSKVKTYHNDIVYLNFAVEQDGGHNPVYKRNKIELACQEAVNIIYKKLLNLANLINPNEEKQLSYYSDFLKSPIENVDNKEENVKTAGSTLSTTSFLSIKFINRKAVIARMHKYKADLYMILNIVELAFVHYAQAFNATKKENDLYWSLSALEGLSVVSYLFLRESLRLQTAESLKNQALQEFKNSIKKRFSSRKDLNSLAIPFADFAKNYTHIINSYNQNHVAKFLALEVSLMAAKLFIKNNMKSEALTFISNSVYISSIQMREESRIRRYLEIGDLYAACGLHRLCSFYKWISINRVFRFLENPTATTQENVNLKCLVARCGTHLLGNFVTMKLYPQVKPLLQQRSDKQVMSRGFPSSKKHMVTQLIELMRFVQNFQDMLKFSKYILNELMCELNETELKFFRSILIKIEPNAKSVGNSTSDDTFKTKFFHLPVLNSFEIQNLELGFNKICKIKSDDQTASSSSGIYIHRYENPLLLAKKKKVHKLQAGNENIIVFTFSNPIPINLNINFIDLIVETQEGKKFTFELCHRHMDEKKRRQFIIQPLAKEFKIKMYFDIKNLGKFQIIGYDINFWNHSNKIVFKDLVKVEATNASSKNRNVLNAATTLESSYDIEVVPKLPLINQIDFYLQDLNKNNVLVGSIVEDETEATIEGRLGICQNFQLQFKTDSEYIDLDVLEHSCVIINEANANKLNVSVALKEQLEESTKKKVFYLQIDATESASDRLFDSTGSDEINLILEVKYTNQQGREENISHVLRKQLSIQFKQLVEASLVSFRTFDSNYFVADLLIKNLSLNLAQLEFKDGSGLMKKEHLEMNAESKHSIHFKKIELDKFEFETMEERLLQLLNQGLNLNVSSESNMQLCVSLKFKNISNLLGHKNVLVKFPFKFTAHLNQDSTDNTAMKLYSLGLILTRSCICEPKNFEYSIQIFNKQRHKIFYPQKWLIKDIDSTQMWFQKLNLILNDQEEAALNIQVCLMSARQTIFEWTFNLHLKAHTSDYMLN